MIGFVAQRLMDMDVENRCGPARGERSDARTNSRNGYREHDCSARLRATGPTCGSMPPT